MIIILAIIIPVIFILTPISKNLGKLAKAAIVVIGIPATLFALAAIQVGTQSPEQSKAQTDSMVAEEMARITSLCGATKEQMEQWMGTHKGWAEHTAVVADCIRTHK